MTRQTILPDKTPPGLPIHVLPDELRGRLTAVSSVPHLLVASDFDGTISPIVSNPADARPLPRAADALRNLAALPHTAGVLISGRSLNDLGTLSGAPTGVQLVGSHGAEFSADFVDSIDAAAKELLQQVVHSMHNIAARYPGATVEPKPVSVAFHVRNVADSDAACALRDASTAVENLNIHTTEGKAVLEFAVMDTNKGSAIDLLRNQCGASAVIYLGDDVTDEKAFARLNPSIDIGIKVGSGPTKAQYRVASPDEVTLSLELVLAERQEFLRKSSC